MCMLLPSTERVPAFLQWVLGQLNNLLFMKNMMQDIPEMQKLKDF